jgi:hypothetical protein
MVLGKLFGKLVAGGYVSWGREWLQVICTARERPVLIGGSLIAAQSTLNHVYYTTCTF